MNDRQRERCETLALHLESIPDSDLEIDRRHSSCGTEGGIASHAGSIPEFRAEGFECERRMVFGHLAESEPTLDGRRSFAVHDFFGVSWIFYPDSTLPSVGESRKAKIVEALRRVGAHSR